MATATTTAYTKPDLWQKKISDEYLKPQSRIAGLPKGNEIEVIKGTNHIRIPDIDFSGIESMYDYDDRRIGASTTGGNAFTPQFDTVSTVFREYSVSRHRSFGAMMTQLQQDQTNVDNLLGRWIKRKMETVVLRDHDKYCIYAWLNGHCTGKWLALGDAAKQAFNASSYQAYKVYDYNTSASPWMGGQAWGGTPDMSSPTTAGYANNIIGYSYSGLPIYAAGHENDALNGYWANEEGQSGNFDIAPSFAAIQAKEFDPTDAKTTIFDIDNFTFNEYITTVNKVFYITKRVKQEIMKSVQVGPADGNMYLSEQWNVMVNGEFAKLWGWTFVEIEDEWLPQLYLDEDLNVVPRIWADPEDEPDGLTLTQVVGFALDPRAIQLYQYWEMPFKFDLKSNASARAEIATWDCRYDAWAVQQLSYLIIPLVMASNESAPE